LSSGGDDEKDGVNFQQYNVPLKADQTTPKTARHIWTLEVLTHLLFSSDLALSYFHLFGPLKKIRGKIKCENRNAAVYLEK